MTSLKDTTRLIPPTIFWAHTHYGNDLGTLYWEKRPITAVPEYTNPYTTHGSQDAVVGYGALWPTLFNQLYCGGLYIITFGVSCIFMLIINP